MGRSKVARAKKSKKGLDQVEQEENFSEIDMVNKDGLDNSKQIEVRNKTKTGKGKVTSHKSVTPRKSMKTMNDKRNSARREITTQAVVENEDEIMQMAVTEQNDELLSEPEHEDNSANYESTEEDSVPELMEDENGSEREDGETEVSSDSDSGSDGYQDQEYDNEVSFSNNNSEAASSFKKRKISGKGSCNEKCATEEMNYDDEERKSMMKFAKFLVNEGFLKRNNEENEQEEMTEARQSGQSKLAGKSAKSTHLVQNREQGLDANDGKGTMVSHPSETTIYREAINMNNSLTDNGVREMIVDDGKQTKRISSSSEEGIDTSGEINELEENENVLVGEIRDFQIEQLQLSPTKEKYLFKQFLDYRLKEQQANIRSRDQQKTSQQQQRPTTSRGGGNGTEKAHDRTKEMLKRVENSKAQIYQVPGKEDIQIPDVFNGSEFYHSVLVDEQYVLVENHVDEVTRRCIVASEFIDLARLLPRDRVQMQQDNHMEMVNRNGHTYWVPATDKDVAAINNYGKWQQAFRVFSTIYVEAHPNKAKELMQYSHVIFLASLTFAWENVYAYDIDFRLHTSKHPGRNWGIILSQAWTMRMHDCIHPMSDKEGNRDGYSTMTPQRPKKICWKYNQGRCTYGFNCKFDHRCGVCGKSGHGAHICRKAKYASTVGGESEHHRKQGSGNHHDKKKN